MGERPWVPGRSAARNAGIPQFLAHRALAGPARPDDDLWRERAAIYCWTLCDGAHGRELLGSR